MHTDYVTKKAKGDAIGYFVMFAIAGGIMSLTSGCAFTNPNGFEIYTDIGLRAEHAHTETKTTLANPAPLKCYFWGFAGCPGTQTTQQGEGS